MMRICILFLIFSSAVYQNACEQDKNIHNSESDIDASSPISIRLGTNHNTLRGVTLTWQSNAKDDSIRWGYTAGYEFGEFAVECLNKYKRNLNTFSFPVLKPLSQIHYTIKSAGEWRENKIFTTSADTSSEIFSFIVGSDSHAGESHFTNGRWNVISDLIANEEIDFCLHMGDVVDDDDDELQWNSFFKSGKSLTENKIIFYTWGNHEYGPIAINNSNLPGNKKWYSFCQGHALFICLLSEEDFETQYDWLLNQLGDTDKEWIFVYFHRPFFTRGKHKDEMNEYRTTWWKAFDDYGVDIVMNGHTHSYLRTVPLNLNISDTSAVAEYGSNPGQGRLEFVSGGLGGDNSKVSEDWFTAKAYSGLHYIKFKIDGKILHFDTYSDSGSLIDSLTIHSARPVKTNL